MKRENESKFKAGDKVKITRIDFEVNGLLSEHDIGKICTVEEYSNFNGKNSLYILDNNFYRANFPEDSLEPIEVNTQLIENPEKYITDVKIPNDEYQETEGGHANSVANDLSDNQSTPSVGTFPKVKKKVLSVENGEVTKIIEVGSFMWAVEQMKNGKKVRRKEYGEGIYCYFEECFGFKEIRIGGKTAIKKDSQFLLIQDFEATDWEIYEENEFGDFEIKRSPGGLIYINNTYNIDRFITIGTDKDLDNLEKAIKRARELRNE